MKVKVIAILDVQNVNTWEEAYENINNLVSGPALYNHVDGKFYSAYLEEVILMEGVKDAQDSQPHTRSY